MPVGVVIVGVGLHSEVCSSEEFLEESTGSLNIFRFEHVLRGGQGAGGRPIGGGLMVLRNDLLMGIWGVHVPNREDVDAKQSRRY